MKTIFFAISILVASTAAFPKQDEYLTESSEERLIETTIKIIIQRIQSAIRDNGLDPLLLDVDVEYDIPLGLKVLVDSLQFTGASNIKVHQVNYSVLLNRLRFDIELPELALSIGDSGISVNLFGPNLTAALRGNAAITGIRVSGEVRIQIGIISGITIRSMEINLGVGDITSDLTVALLGVDFSNIVNVVLNDTIPVFLADNENEINRVITDIIRTIADSILK